MYQAQFCRIDGIEQVDVGGVIRLCATAKNAAEDEVLALHPPHGANFVKILLDGRVVAKLGFAL